MALPYMDKHRGFPGRLPGTDFQFVLRRANKDGATELTERVRYPDRRPADKRADVGFMQALLECSGCGPPELAVRPRGDPRRRPV